MTKTRLDWAAIRPLNGEQSAGFEELCAQLARAITPAGYRFVRKGTPDGGVECYAAALNGREWGWQAKYFRGALGDKQWEEIDKSVATALDKHPKLARYYVCVPRDLSDGRVDRVEEATDESLEDDALKAPQKRRLLSERDRWNKRAEKWAQAATDRGMTVEFVFWGSSELLERLSEPQHIGRVRFWFDVRGFDADWFRMRLEESLLAAGPRYTPEINVSLPISAEFEAFGRTEAFYDSVKAKVKLIRKSLRDFERAEAKDAQQGGADASLRADVSRKCRDLVEDIAATAVEPVGPPFGLSESRATELLNISHELEQSLIAREDVYFREAEKAGTEDGADASRRPGNPFAELGRRLRALQFDVANLRHSLESADRLASGTIMLLAGDAGTGKTHLLCDVARRRLEEGRPTILLMGQRFLSVDDPWVHALQQLDLVGVQAEEFVGALEAAAQAAGCRALVMVDALNEGAGVRFWPSHLATFLARLERSSWIGVVLSVRSSYEEVVIPEEVRNRTIRIRHQGFAECEYDAAKTFFRYYGIELPSTPLLTPEFRNPLFLKTLCRGLKDSGERRVPKGFQGITSVFERYLGASNKRLSEHLRFNPKHRLVWRAIAAIAEGLVKAGERWLPAMEAERTVNAFLPGQDFERSLYRGLVSEGLLIEEARRPGGDHDDDVTYVAYDRLADHLVAKSLLDRHLDAADPKTAFSDAGPLGYLGDPEIYVSPGLLEALCVQVPERTKLELPIVVPGARRRPGIGYAFRQSIVWRSMDAFSSDTRDCLNALIVTDQDAYDTLDTILTTAIVPGHPFNAGLLDGKLRGMAMPDRDAWWSIYLHNRWGSKGPVDRIVDWSWSISPDEPLADDTVELCATVLAWMLTTSNRFLRDRATKGLISLLSGRLAVAEKLVGRFAKVNDPYVTERVFAVAYGVAMRSHDKDGVGRLATRAYNEVFAEGVAPPHILLRDYARGVVERASFLGAPLEVDLARIRPPYGSRWPKIPTDEEIKLLLPDWSQASHDSGNPEWSRQTIGASVLHGDFARYIIGTNSNYSNWLPLRLSDPPWRPPPTRDEAIRAFESALSKREAAAWRRYQGADAAERQATKDFVRTWYEALPKDERKSVGDPQKKKALARSLVAATPVSLNALTRAREAAEEALAKALTAKHRNVLKEARELKNVHFSSPPRFDLKLVQRYVLWRVFDLGWTTKRFGWFDRFAVSSEGRGEHKAERIGKKYQWIAYHEAMAFVADNFQYRERRIDEKEGQVYEGPWQEIGLRDIDPSCTLLTKPGGTSWEGHAAAWWGAARYDAWPEAALQKAWLASCDDLPSVRGLLVSQDPSDGSSWLNVEGYYSWRQPTPPDIESSDVERGELWYLSTGYLIRAKDADAFMSWAEGVDFWGRWMPKTPEIHGIFLGEHAWSSAARYFQTPYHGDDGWVKPREDCPVEVRAMALEYHKETGSDGSVDEGYTLRLPAGDVMEGMALRWDGYSADFLDGQGRLAAFDPTAHSDGPTTVLMRKDALEAFLKRAKLTVCWAVLGEKRILGPSMDADFRGALRMTGAYVLKDGLAKGFVKYIEDDGKTPNKQVGLTREGA